MENQSLVTDTQTEYTYKLTPSTGILRYPDQVVIPVSEGNMDYYQYLQWLDKGNTPIPCHSFVELQTQKWEEFKQLRDNYKSLGFISNKNIYDSDDESISYINSAVLIATIPKSVSQPFSIDWTLKNNTTVSLDADQMIQVGMDCMTYAQGIFNQGISYRTQINAATTQEELDAIKWSCPPLLEA